MQLDASHCARCGVDLEAAFRQKRKEDLMIEKKIRALRAQREVREQEFERPLMQTEARHKQAQATPDEKRGVLHWLKR